MSFASDLAIGFKSLFGNTDIQNFDSDDVKSLPEELRTSINSIKERAFAEQKRMEKGIKLSSSERTITAPNIPVIGSIIAWYKKNKINKQLKSGLKAMEKSKEKMTLEKDSIVQSASETNPYTNPNGKNIIRTQAAGDIQNTPRELGGEERTRKGH